ncbi:glutaminase, partial [Paraburkholderia sp. SIMBA_049]
MRAPWKPGPAPALPHVMNYQPILQRIHTELAPWIGQGRVADYIPEPAKVP